MPSTNLIILECFKGTWHYILIARMILKTTLPLHH